MQPQLNYSKLLSEFDTERIVDVPVANCTPGTLRRITKAGLTLLKKGIAETGIVKHRLPITAIPLSWYNATSLVCRNMFFIYLRLMMLIALTRPMKSGWLSMEITGSSFGRRKALIRYLVEFFVLFQKSTNQR